MKFQQWFGRWFLLVLKKVDFWCEQDICPFDHLNKKAFDWSNSGKMTSRNLKKSLRSKIMHHLDETLASSINSQHILDCKWKPIISDFLRFLSKFYSNWRITKVWKTSENLFLNTVNRAHSKIIYDNRVRMVKNSTSLGPASHPDVSLQHVRAKEGGKETTSIPFPWSLVVHHQSLVSRSLLLCKQRSAWGGGWFRTFSWCWPLAFLSHFLQDWWNF